jgi:hypothetical protein
MSNFNLKEWRQRLGIINRSYAAITLGLTINEYDAYEEEEIPTPKYVELAAFAIELGNICFQKAREQYPKYRHRGIGYGYTKSHFLKLFFEEKKLLYSIKLNKTEHLLLKGSRHG